MRLYDYAASGNCLKVGEADAGLVAAARVGVVGDVRDRRARADEPVAWADRLRALPRFVDDLAPYPPNAQAGAGRSIND